jgi:hypothetical protein
VCYFVEFRTCELLRILLLRTRVNKGMKKGRRLAPRPFFLPRGSDDVRPYMSLCS